MLKNPFRKNEEPDYDPTNIKVTDLSVGFLFEYDLRQWEVLNESTYDWGDNFFSKEYKITDGRETYSLYVEEDDELEIILYTKVKIGQIDGDIEDEILDNEKPPKKVVYNGQTYTRERESPGYFNPTLTSKEWIEFISWQYYDSEAMNALSIEQWGDTEFEASAGKILQPYEISNILPSE